LKNKNSVDGESEKKKHQDFERVSGALMRGGLKRIRPIEIVFFLFLSSSSGFFDSRWGTKV
jgi:hypothetical protein